MQHVDSGFRVSRPTRPGFRGHSERRQRRVDDRSKCTPSDEAKWYRGALLQRTTRGRHAGLSRDGRPAARGVHQAPFGRGGEVRQGKARRSAALRGAVRHQRCPCHGTADITAEPLHTTTASAAEPRGCGGAV